MYRGVADGADRCMNLVLHYIPRTSGQLERSNLCTRTISCVMDSSFYSTDYGQFTGEDAEYMTK